VATPRTALTPALRQAAPALSHPSTRSARARRGRAGVLVGASAAMTVALLPGTSAADPGDRRNPATSEEAAELVADASHELEFVTEEFNEAREVLRRQKAEVAEAEQTAAEAEEELASLDGQIRELARTAYTGDSLSSTLDLMLTSDSADDFVDSLGTLDAIAGHTDDAIAEVVTVADEAESARAAAEAAAADAADTVERIRDQQADLEARIADYEEQYEELSAAEQAEVDRAHGGTVVATPQAAPAPGGAAQAAVDTAMAQIGDPYVWAAAGPDAFDCSGLTQYAYAAAGVSLPHSSRMQSQMGTPVSRSELQPGDLVFFYSPVSHVGMYIGNGQMVHASTSGQPVQVAGLDSMGSFSGARRVA
jgi:cell wall-associated NlpC family hydrolase